MRSSYEFETLGKVQGVGLPQKRVNDGECQAVKHFSASRPDRFACSLTNDFCKPATTFNPTAY